MNCPKCNGETKLIPAGISKKSGKPYSAFVSCNDRQCGGTAPVNGSDVKKVVVQNDSIRQNMMMKQDSIALAGSIRDAVAITAALIHSGTLMAPDEIKTSIQHWKDVIYEMHIKDLTQF